MRLSGHLIKREITMKKDTELMLKRFEILPPLAQRKLLLFAQILIDAQNGKDTLNNAWYRACQTAEQEEKEKTNNA